MLGLSDSREKTWECSSDEKLLDRLMWEEDGVREEDEEEEEEGGRMGRR